MKAAFYYVDEDYIAYLKNTEIESRGFTTVPNVKYANSHKFVYGAVMSINEIDYFVPVSSYIKKQEDNIVIKVSDREKKGEKDRVLLEKEYRFCKSKRSLIQKQARRTYERVIAKVSMELIKNSCDFRLLEKACKEYDNV